MASGKHHSVPDRCGVWDKSVVSRRRDYRGVWETVHSHLLPYSHATPPKVAPILYVEDGPQYSPAEHALAASLMAVEITVVASFFKPSRASRSSCHTMKHSVPPMPLLSPFFIMLDTKLVPCLSGILRPTKKLSLSGMIKKTMRRQICRSWSKGRQYPSRK